MGRAHGFHACKFTGIVLHAYYPDFGSSYPSFCVLGDPILMKKPESAGRSRQGPTFHHRKTLIYNPLLYQIRNLRVVLRCANRVRERQWYFQENARAWKKIFQGMKKFFQRLKKFFHALEKIFQALAIFLKIMACRWSAFQGHLAESGCKTKGEKGDGARFFCSSQPVPLPKCSHFSPLEWGIIALQSMPLL